MESIKQYQNPTLKKVEPTFGNSFTYKLFEEALNLAPNKQDVPSIYSYMGVSLKDIGADVPCADNHTPNHKC